MSEWWTYTLSDFLLFSAPTYHRLFELYNREIWPAQIVALAFGMFVFALIVQPAMGALSGRPWLQAEVFGVAPDPTVVATLGVLMLATRRSPWLLLIIPIISGATLWAMESGDALVMPLIALLALLVAVRKAWSPACPAGSSRL